MDAFAAADGAAVFGVVNRVIEGGHEPRRFAADLLDRLRDLIILGAVPGAGDLMVSGTDGANFQVGRFTATGTLDGTFAGGLTHYFPGAAASIAVVPHGLPGAGDVVGVLRPALQPGGFAGGVRGEG